MSTSIYNEVTNRANENCQSPERDNPNILQAYTYYTKGILF